MCRCFLYSLHERVLRTEVAQVGPAHNVSPRISYLARLMSSHIAKKVTPCLSTPAPNPVPGEVLLEPECFDRDSLTHSLSLSLSLARSFSIYIYRYVYTVHECMYMCTYVYIYIHMYMRRMPPGSAPLGLSIRSWSCWIQPTCRCTWRTWAQKRNSTGSEWFF